MENFKVFEELLTTKSVVEKEQILLKYQDDHVVMELLRRNLDPYFLTYTKALPSFVEFEGDEDLALVGLEAYTAFIGLTDRLNNRTITGNAAKAEVSTFFSQLTKGDISVYKKILLKQSIGVGAKTVNKVWAGLVPEFVLMLAPTELADITKLKYPYIIQPKYDGFRAIYRQGRFWTRGGLSIPNQFIPDYFQSLMGMEEWVLDGELYDPTITFQKLNSILTNETKSLTGTKLKYIVYDCMKKTEWDAQVCKTEYQTRLKNVRKIVTTISDYKKVIDIGSDLVGSSLEVKNLYKQHLDNGFEGSMLKDPLGFYSWKRVTVKSGEMLKLKPFESVDAPIIGFYEGKEKYTGVLGGIIIDLGNNQSCSVGSGFSDATRKEIWNNQSKYLGKMCEIKYFEKTDENSLRHPTFERFREDKD